MAGSIRTNALGRGKGPQGIPEGEGIIMKKFLHILLIATLAFTLVFGGATSAFGASAAETNGIKVIYDGKYITFKDAAPKIVEGRTMVPFRQILEDMGSDVSYDNATRTVTAQKGGLSFFFKIGGTDITVNDGVSTYVRKMDVVPFVDSRTNRTYVPARFMAETLGYAVGWDNYDKTVIINDYGTLFANADEDFSILNYLVATDMDLEKTWRSVAEFEAAYTIAMGEDVMEFNIQGDVDSIQYKTDADMVMDMSIDLGDTMSDMPEEEQTMAQTMTDMMKDMSYKIKMNGSDGIMYMNSNFFSTIDPTMTDNTWIKMDLFKMYDDMGLDMRGLMKMSEEATSIEKMLTDYASVAPLTDADSFEAAKTTYEFMKNLIGDDAFKKQVSGSSATYTLNIDSSSVALAIGKTALAGGASMSADDISEVISALDEADFDMDLVIKTRNDVLDTYTMEGGAEYEDGSFTLDISGTTYDTDMSMNFDMGGMAAMDITMTVFVEETSKAVDLTLPAGATIVDYESMMQY